MAMIIIHDDHNNDTEHNNDGIDNDQNDNHITVEPQWNSALSAHDIIIIIIIKFWSSPSKLSIVAWLETNLPPLPTIAPAAKEIFDKMFTEIFIRQI